MMTSPIEEITVRCPECDAVYQDWWRPSLNLSLDPFDEAYVKEATTSKCPKCGFVVQHDALIVGKDGVFSVVR